MDKLYEAGLTQVFVKIALAAAEKFGVKKDTLHLDSSSFHVHGEYAITTAGEMPEDLKEFIVDLMCSGDGDIPLYIRVAAL